jgi:hypothetical protein
MSIVQRDDKYITGLQAFFGASDGTYFFWQGYNNDVDWTQTLFCYKRNGTTLELKWSRTVVQLEMFTSEWMDRMWFDGTYLAIAAEQDGLFVFTVDDSGPTLVDSHYDPAAIGGSSRYESIIKNGDTWHVCCSSGGVKAYRLIANVLHLVGYAPIHDGANRAGQITCSADGTYIYVSEVRWFGSTTNNIFIYQYNGSAYTQLGTSDAMYDVQDYDAKAICIGQEVYFGGVPFTLGDGFRQFHHNTSTHTLENVGTRFSGYSSDSLHYDGTYIYVGGQDGFYVLDPNTFAIVFAEDSGDFLYYDVWSDGRWIFGVYDNWELDPTHHGMLLFENEVLPPPIPVVEDPLYLRELRPRRKFDRFDYLHALRGLLPRGVAWEIPLPNEQDIAPVSIASSEAWGRILISQGELIITPNGITSSEQWGLPTVSNLLTIVPVGIASSEQWGSPRIGMQISVNSIVTSETWGSPTVSTT